MIINDRRSTVSIYILCRVLIEIIGQSSLEAVTNDMAYKLEDIIFNQLRSADPEILARSPLRVANWRLFGMLLGVMSNLDFETVTDRFFKELEDLKEVQVTKDGEAKVEMVVRGMTYLRLKVFLSRRSFVTRFQLLIFNSYILNMPWRNPPSS